MLYHRGDRGHTQNVQINKVIGENEKCVFYLTKKTKWTFWPTRYISATKSNHFDFPKEILPTFHDHKSNIKSFTYHYILRNNKSG